MRGDFSRNTHRPDRGYSRVLWQQGRVILDADLNEQGEIQLRTMRLMMRDLVGPHGGPADALGFAIETTTTEDEAGKLVLVVKNGVISANGIVARPRGRYYVDGIMVEHGDPLDFITDFKAQPGPGVLLVYLEVWERFATWVEENEELRAGSMREVALGGPDTAGRSQVMWRVVAKRYRLPEPRPYSLDLWASEELAKLQPTKGTLSATLNTLDIGESDPCRDPAESHYRGPENRLYRVEIHAAEGPEGADPPTFKWSRENGSVVYPVHLEASITFELQDGEQSVTLVHLGRDDRHRLRVGDIVELVTSKLDAASEAGPLLEVRKVDESARTVTLRPLGKLESKLDVEVDLEVEPPKREWALLRRWDQPLEPKKANGAVAKSPDGAVVIDGEDKELPLEDGISVKFKKAAGSDAYGFQVGDYWLIPARTIPTDIEWPQPVDQSPHGIERHYAPLAIVGSNGEVELDLRKKIVPLGT